MRIDVVEATLGEPDEREIDIRMTPHDQWLTYAYPDGTIIVTLKKNYVTAIARNKTTSNNASEDIDAGAPNPQR